MHLRRTTTTLLLGSLTMATALPIAAHAASPHTTRAPKMLQTAQGASPAQGVQPAPRWPRASLSVKASRPEPWVGQAVPVTVTALFRDVEGVTLEGAPTLASKAIVTSVIAPEPRQSTEIVGGERVLVARWMATVTPSSSGALDLTAELPVRLRYREAAPRAVRPAPETDPFSDVGDGDPFDAIFNRLQQRMQQHMLEATEESAGRIREETLQLKASTPPLDVRALPTANRPATFTGAVGVFDIDATVSSTRASVSDPITLRIAVGGDVDLDRVDLPGVMSSSTWKAYPPRVIPAAPDAGKPTAKATKKIFEQIIVPLRGGELTVPKVSFTSFDPTSVAYVTRSTKPLLVTVNGAASPVADSPPLATTPATGVAATPHDPASVRPAPVGPVRVVTPRHVVYGILPVLLLVMAAVVFRVVRRKRGVSALRRSMQRAATTGDVEPFLGSAHRLIAARLSEHWGVAPDDVTPARVRERLGPDGEPLVAVLVADAALRFGRGGLEGVALGPLCKSVERSLRGAT